MKNTFPEYYPIDKDVVNEVWSNGIFCYDTNVLLNLYRYSNDTRNKIIDNIEYFIKRTIMPYQACYEYHNNKREVETSLYNSYDKIIDIINKVMNSLSTGELAGYRKHCALDVDKDIINPFESTSNKVIKKLEETKDSHASFVDFNAVHQKITQLFDGIVSAKFSDEELKKIYAEGKIRYEKKIPPGFADQDSKKKNGDNSLYGDLIIWKHLIDISQKENTDIIFITDDRKKDWWDIYNGENKGVRPELYREFKEQTSKRILIYSVKDFMKYAPEHSTISVSKKVINEIEELRKVEERRKDYVDKEAWLKIIELRKYNDIWENINKQSAFGDKITNQSLADYSKFIQDHNNNIANVSYLTAFAELLNKINAPQEAIKKTMKAPAVLLGNIENNEEE